MSAVTAGHYFVAGTDTGVGKTRVTAGLLAAARAAGLPVAGMKPVAAGADWHDGRLINADAAMIAAATGQSTPYEELNPYCLAEPTSPHIAARNAKITIDKTMIAAIAARIGADRALFLVEGAGGWYAPISERESMADVAIALGLPVLLVVGLRLGCLNHARLTREAIERSGCRFAGWIGSRIDAGYDPAAEHVATLAQLLGAAPLAVLPHTVEVTNDALALQNAAMRLIRVVPQPRQPSH